MAIVRLEALRRFKEALALALPDVMPEHIHIGQTPTETPLCFPTISIIPVRFKYTSDQESEHKRFGADVVVYEVGRWRITMQIRLAHSTWTKRMELQEAVVNAFMQDPDRPGVLLTEVTACRELGNFLAAWEMDDDDFEDERAFDSQYWGTLALTGIIPALVVRENVYTIDDLRLGLTHEMSAAVDSETFDSSSDVEVVQIEEDGSITSL